MAEMPDSIHSSTCYRRARIFKDAEDAAAKAYNKVRNTSMSRAAYYLRAARENRRHAEAWIAHARKVAAASR